MPRHAIKAGDRVYVPGGVLHSFGPDTLITEIQQTSDLARHVMPAELYGQPLPEAEWDANIEAALDELRMDWRPQPQPGLAVERDGNRYVYGAAGPYFALQRWTLREPHRGTTERGCLTVTNLGAPVQITSETGVDSLERASSCILPAALGAYEITFDRKASPADLVICWVPDLQRDVVAPLREAGYGDAEIATHGEVRI